MATTSNDSNNTTIKVKLQLHATKLKNVAGAFKGTSDPFAVVTLLAAGANEQPVVLGKTEVIKNTLNPTWTKTFPLDYSLGKLRHINVGIYDEIRKSNDKPMGSAMFEIGDILGSKGNVKGKKLQRGGFLYVRVTQVKEDLLGAASTMMNGDGVSQPSDEIQQQQQEEPKKLTLKLRGVKLKNVEGFFGGKSDPFYEISKSIDLPAGGKAWRVYYRSTHCKNNLDPIWDEHEIDLSDFCEDYSNWENESVLISVFDHERSGKHTPMGSFETTVNGLIQGVGGESRENGFTLRRKNKIFGSIVVMKASLPPVEAVAATPAPAIPACTGYAESPYQPSSISDPPAATSDPPPYVPPAAIDHVMPIPVPLPADDTHQQQPYQPTPPSQKPTFIDYISGSCELNTCVAIDFTGSNGDPRQYGTLHYIHRDGQLNDYEKAIVGVGSILAKYDYYQKFPVWGFGAKYGGVIQHCFQVGCKAEADGMGGVLEAYRSVFRTGLVMSGPTVFADCISQAATKARKEQELAKQRGAQAYTVLLLLSDGSVTDVGRTKSAIMAASDAPLSIVIVGIGQADFSAMRFLDDFSDEHDIVQFVEFNAHKYNKESLTSATLDEIPDQLVKYFYSRGIMPTAMMGDSQFSIEVEDYDETADVDLSMNFNSEGEIALNGHEGTFVDNSYEGTAAKYDGLQILPPPVSVPAHNPAASVPPSSQSHCPSTSVPPPSTYQPHDPVSSMPQQSHHQTHNPHAGPPSYQRRHTYTPGHSAPPAAAAPAPSLQPTFQVQVPPNGRPGMQLQVRNPRNGQLVRVTIPQGVGPGGRFGVAA